MTTLNGILLRTQELLSKENLALVHRSLVNLEQTTGADGAYIRVSSPRTRANLCLKN
jgi:hypothetical protein